MMHVSISLYKAEGLGFRVEGLECRVTLHPAPYTPNLKPSGAPALRGSKGLAQESDTLSAREHPSDSMSETFDFSDSLGSINPSTVVSREVKP